MPRALEHSAILTRGAGLVVLGGPDQVQDLIEASQGLGVPAALLTDSAIFAVDTGTRWLVVGLDDDDLEE